jgi:sugar O-acyltransferase (sialic acid O-acetyltransferase NeuD family)
MIIIGYSGHAFVAIDILLSQDSNNKFTHYCDNEKKTNNPFSLEYLGNELSETALKMITESNFFVGIGDNNVRRKIFENISNITHKIPINLIHPSSIVSSSAHIKSGVMVAGRTIINPFADIGNGSIVNTGAIIEHECIIGDFAHIGPGAILCGNVSVGENSFIGAGAIVRQGISIGSNVIVGAGAVVVKNVVDNATVMGCPAK